MVRYFIDNTDQQKEFCEYNDQNHEQWMKGFTGLFA